MVRKLIQWSLDNPLIVLLLAVIALLYAWMELGQAEQVTLAQPSGSPIKS